MKRLTASAEGEVQCALKYPFSGAAIRRGMRIIGPDIIQKIHDHIDV